MGRGGRERLGTTDPFAGVVESVVPRQGLTDAEAERLGEFVERLSGDGTHRGLLAIAPHGGDIEPHTDTQAVRVAECLTSYGVSAWLCKGFGLSRRGAAALHVTSVDIHPASFPALGSVIGRRFRYAVAFHGFRRFRDPGADRGAGRRVQRGQPAEHRQPAHRRRARRHPSRAEPGRPDRPRAGHRRCRGARVRGRLARPPGPGPWWWRLLRRLWDALRSRLQSRPS